MQRATLLFPLALFLTPGTGSRDTLAWKPTEGTLVRIFETSSESELEGLGMFLDGDERENPHGGGPPQMMIKSAERNVFVDEILGQQQAVIKGLTRQFGQARGVSGCTILGDGEVSLILDVGTLLGMVGGRASTSTTAQSE